MSNEGMFAVIENKTERNKCQRDVIDKKKGFEVRCIAKHENVNYGDVSYIKPVEFYFSTPTLYAILNRADGTSIGYITGSEFKNMFTELSDDKGVM